LISATSQAENFPDTIREVLPSVVVISAISAPDTSVIDSIFEEAVVKQGTGFFIDEDTIVTSYHVIKGTTDVYYRAYNQNKRLKAKIVGYDPAADIVVLDIMDEDKSRVSGTPVKWHQGETQVGEDVFSVGHPFGFEFTVTKGIVSFAGRRDYAKNFIRYIQTDAAVNTGNSGGPLFNMNGEVIGIIQAIITISGGSNGISLATDSELSQQTIQRILLEKGEIKRSSFGVISRGTTQGILITEVMKNSPAKIGGLKKHDLIISVDGVPMVSSYELIDYVQSLRPGTTVNVTVRRGRDTITIPVVLGFLLN
jgi:serine protease Do